MADALDYGDAPRTGLVFGPSRGLVALDVDVTDPETNALVRQAGVKITGGTEFWRIGRAPKFLALFRGKVRSQRLLCEGGGIDVFGSSGQCAIYGAAPVHRQALRMAVARAAFRQAFGPAGD